MRREAGPPKGGTFEERWDVSHPRTRARLATRIRDPVDRPGRRRLLELSPAHAEPNTDANCQPVPVAHAYSDAHADSSADAVTDGGGPGGRPDHCASVQPDPTRSSA